MLARELKLLWLGVTGWWKPDPIPDNKTSFSCYKESGWIGFLSAIILLVLFEGLAIQVFLYGKSPLIVYIHSGLEVYGIVWLLGDFQAIKKNLIRLSDTLLQVRVGFRWAIEIPLINISAAYEGQPEAIDAVVEWKMDEFIKEVKVPGYSVISLMGKANLHLVLKEPMKIRGWFGQIKNIDRIGLEIDSPAEFLQAVCKYIAPK